MAEKSAEASPSVASTLSFESSSGNWWDSWLSSAKNKSAEVYSMVKKDLDEIGTAVKSEASHVFSTTSNVMSKTFKLDVPESPANVMKKSITSFIGQVSTVLSPEPDDEDDTEVILSSGDTTMLSTYKKELEALQRVDATFIVPAYSPEFEAWRASLELSDASVITPSAAVRRLDTSPVLKSQYDKLVPDAVSHDDFWERYLFRVALLQDRLAAAARRQPVSQPSTDPVMAHLPLQSEQIESPKKTPVVDKERDEIMHIYEKVVEEVDTVAWEDDFANDLELTEEQQTLLLEEYEQEIASKKTKQRDVTNNNAQNREKENKNKNVKNNTDKKSPKKTDVCGNNLVEDYFGDEKVKDDASANSDESWEKEFEIEDVEKA
ncbi:BSD domain-containing protein 1-like isoform X2 [Hyposmocoma kahamanoa]|uniref:BSD domain-containing protein 1-like isoform X2 n=1 Tax=Hyposmocoma kahamanoa TaxID=1477025 RepID=UPI000E6D7676|nr:BSD domain-containing protein 1-like isoform X2 [Hyposmocoma kahamanoa]